jgi:hypothetical protein
MTSKSITPLETSKTTAVPFTKEQTEFIASVRTHYTDRNHSQISDGDIVKFLLGQKGSEANALQKIGENLEWKLTYSLAGICNEDFSALSRSGKLYFSGGFDLDGFPIVIFRANRHFYDDYDHNVRFVVHFVERIKIAGLHKVTLLVDRFDMKSENTDDLFIKHLAAVFQVHFRVF